MSKVSENCEMETREDFLRSVVAEAVLCIGRHHSTAARLASSELLQGLSAAMRRIHNNDSGIAITKCMKLLSGGLAGRPNLCANTVYAITVFTYYNKDMSVDIVQEYLGYMCHLLESVTREVVQACLSFVKGVVSLYPSLYLGPLVPTIMKGLSSMVKDCSRRYRTKTDSIISRLIEKFGADHISTLVPPHNEILHKRLRNLRKKSSRSKRAKEAEDQQEGCDDNAGTTELFTEKAPTSLEEILAAIDPDLVGADDEEGKKKSPVSSRQKKRNQPTAAWVEEDDSEDEVLDLLGPAAAQAIRATKPRAPKQVMESKQIEKEEEVGFPTNELGKLIIYEDKKADKLEKWNREFLSSVYLPAFWMEIN